jgi:serine/threonine-protein kinase
MSDEDAPASGPVGPLLALGADLPPGYVVGEYKIEGVAGRGGMGVVYSALQPVIEKRVAIKVLNAQFSAEPGLVKRFVDEARAVNRIRHANIIDIFSFGQLADGRQYFVMEYLEGSTLGVRLERGDLALEEVPVFLEQMCDALEAAHGERIVHRDLKPDNVWIVTPRHGRQFVKLLDFGIAKLLATGDRSTTETGVVMGTPHYMSPEQCHGRAVDHRTDIYAMGVILYRLYTGRLPFQGETFAEILAKQVTETPEPPGRLVALPPALDQLIVRCLSKNPADRPQSAAELGRALREIFAGGSGPAVLAAPAAPISTTLTSSASEVRARTAQAAQAPSAGRRIALVSAGALAALLTVGGVARLVSRRPVAVTPGVSGPSSVSAAGSPAPAAPLPPAVAPRPAPPPAAIVPAPPAPTAVAPAPATPATDEDAAAKAAKRRAAAGTAASSKPAHRDAPGAPGGPPKPARSRASDTGLVTDNPFQ